MPMELHLICPRRICSERFILSACTILSCFFYVVLARGQPDRSRVGHLSHTTTNQTLSPGISRSSTFDRSHSVEITPSGNISWLLGSSLTLSCSADSVPAPCYCWFFNDTSADVEERDLTINLTSWENEGIYKCCVHNPQTNVNACASTFVRIKTSEETQLELHGKLIAAICLGLVGIIALVMLLLCYFRVRVQSENPAQINSIPSLYGDLPSTQEQPGTSLTA
nr:carcinoembryonic antigen-related cell adhesion molecule 20 [Pogona vitticeps]